jgi:hypothetical protein
MTRINRRAFLRQGAAWTATGLLLPASGLDAIAHSPRRRGLASDELRGVVRGYVDTLLADGRDRYGAQDSPLIAAALDHDMHRLPEGERLEQLRTLPRSEWGIRSHDRILTGANPMHDQNLYQILYALADTTGSARYRDTADEILQHFFATCQHPATGLLAWGEHSGWDFWTEAIVDREAGRTHEFFRPWVLWDRSFELAPAACARFARGLWAHQIADHTTGNFSRHARIDRHEPGRNSEYPRHGGFFIATWAHAYERTGDPTFPEAVRTLVDYFDGRRSAQTDAIPAESAARSQGHLVWPHSNLGLAVDLHRHANKMSGDLPEQMQTSAARTDDVFLRLDHRPTGDGWGFVKACHTHTLEPGDVRDPDARFTTRKWATGYGDATDARIALICHLRYQQTERVGYRRLVLDTADRYLEGTPDPDVPLFPGTVGHVILLELAAHTLTGEPRYLDRAYYLADFALDTFWSEDSPLPCASSQHAHYEAITRADTLVMALLQLWAREQNLDEPLALRFNDR